MLLFVLLIDAHFDNYSSNYMRPGNKFEENEPGIGNGCRYTHMMYTILAFKGYRPAAQDSHIIHFANTCINAMGQEKETGRVNITESNCGDPGELPFFGKAHEC